MSGSQPKHCYDACAYLLLAGFILIILAACYALGLDTLFAGYSRVRRMILLCLVSAASFGFLLHQWRRTDPADARGTVAVLLRSPRRCALAVGCLALMATILIGELALQWIPLSSDEGAYIFQSNMFALGRLWTEPTRIQPYISQGYIFPLGDKLVSQYPPGWSAILAAASLVGIPAVLTNPIIAALTLLALWRFAARQYGHEAALIAVTLTAVSAFFLFNSASFFNGALVALLGVLFTTAVCAFIETPRIGSAIGIGFWFSAIAMTRHFDAILFGAPAAMAILWRSNARHWALVPVAAASAVPLVAATLYYYYLLTGSLFASPQTLRNPADGLLGENWHIARATELLTGRIIELAEWTSPPFVVALAWSLLQRARQGSLRFFDLYPLVFLTGYWLYWSDGGFRWGPRYIYPALPFMTLTIAAYAWSVVRDRSKARFMHLVAVCAIASGLQVPFLAARAKEIIDQAQDIPRQARAAGIHNAVVITASPVGTIWKVDVGDLSRNGLTLEGDVIYAHGPGLFSAQITPADLDQAVKALQAYFPTRSVWLYWRDPSSVHGHLVKQ